MGVERTDGPFEYYPELHAGVSGDTIRSDAEDPGLNASTIEALAGELEGDAQKVGSELSGDITADVQVNPREASDTAKQLAAKGYYAIGLVKTFAGMVDAFDTTVNGLNHSYKSNLASAMRYAGQAAAATPDPDDDKEVTEAKMGPSIKAYLQPQYDAAVTKLDDDADSIASRFKQGATPDNVRELIRAGLIPLAAAGFYPGLELSAADKQEFWRNTLGQMSAQQQIDWVNQHKDDLPPEAAAAIRPEVQEQFATEVANDIKDRGDIDADTVRLMTFFQSEQAFAHKLYTEVSPDEMADAVQAMSGRAFPYADNRPMYDRVEDVQLYKGLLDAAGVAFATYTKGTGAYAPPSNLAETWANAITDEDNPENAAALTLLIRHGGDQTSFDDRFITDVTGKVYEWERSHDGDPVWRPLAERYSGSDGSMNIMDPSIDLGDPDDPYDDRAWGRNAYDGLANLLAGMENSPPGAEDFFMGHYAGSTETMQEKVDYLMGGEDARNFSQDDGDGVGKAFQAAIVGGDTRDADGTAIANELFHTIAEHSGEGDGWGPDDTWHVWNGMTDSLGTIAAGYSGDVYDIIDNNTVNAGDPLHLNLSLPDMDKVLGEIGHSPDKSGIETLTTSVVMEGNNRTGEWLEDWKADHPGVDQPTLEDLKPDLADMLGLGQRNGEVVRHLLDHSVTVDKSEEEAAATRAAYLSKALSIASSFVPGAGDVLGEGASDLAKTAFDTTKGEALSAIQNAVGSAPASESEAYTSQAAAVLPNQLQYGMISELYNHGFLGPQDGYEGVDASMLTDGQPPQIRPDLYDQDGVSGLNGDLTPAQRQEIVRHWNAWVNSNVSYVALGLTSEVKDSFYHGAGLPG